MKYNKIKLYLDGTMLRFKNGETDTDIVSYPTGAIRAIPQNNTGFAFEEIRTGDIIAFVNSFDDVLDAAGATYGADQSAVITAINAFLNFKNGGGGGGFTPTTDVLQSQIVRFNSDTVANTKPLPFIEGERVHIEELDEVFEAIEGQSNLSAPTEANNYQLYGSLFISSQKDGGTFGKGHIFSYDQATDDYIILYSFGQDDAALGYNPFGSMFIEGNVAYGTTAAGGANGRGTMFKFDLVTNTLSTVSHLTDASGYIDNNNVISSRDSDPVIIGDYIYEAFLLGGANGFGTISKFHKTTGAITVILDRTVAGATDTSTILKVASDGNLIATVDKDIYRIEVATDTITHSSVMGGTTPYGWGMLDDPLDSAKFYHLSRPLTRVGIITNRNYSDLAINSSVAVPKFTFLMYFYAGTLYYVRIDNISTNLEIYNLAGTLIYDSSSEGLTGFDPQDTWNRGHIIFSNKLYFSTRTKLYEFDLVGLSLREEMDSTTIIPSNALNPDDTYVIALDNGLYLQVRDNHLKAVSATDEQATFTSTRGVDTVIPLGAIKAQTISNDTYPNSNTYFTVTSQGAQTLDVTANCSEFINSGTTSFYDAVNDVIKPTEGKYYQVRLITRILPTADQNKLIFVLQNVHDSNKFTKSSESTVKIGVNILEFAFTPFQATANQAATGIKLKLDDFQGGTNCRLFNFKIEIVEL